ncbi:actin-like protein arp8 [Thoreauomyces humboldtii]|nr:actin-like protein arp8 [Thoreauomyces humboldtii]
MEFTSRGPPALPQLRTTSIPTLTNWPPNPKTLQSTYLRLPPNHHPDASKAAPPDNVRLDPAQGFDDVLVIHAGSRNLRIGRASDPLPKEVPHLLVRRMQSTAPTTPVERAALLSVAGPFKDSLRTVPGLYTSLRDDLKQRMRDQKVRSVTNAHAQVVGFNNQVVPESIPDHNDPYKMEWTDLKSGVDHVVGLKALRVANPDLGTSTSSTRPEDNGFHYQSFYPIQHGLLNCKDYTSARTCLADMETIWTETIETELDIPRTSFNSHNVVVLIPDLFSKVHLREMVRMLLKDMNFRGVTLLQESVGATYGAGLSTACVVDIGAQKTTISCIEDGLCQPHTRINLKHGGDDVTAFLMKLLGESSFPYKQFNLKANSYDWLLADELKEKFCTFNESEMMVNLCDFYIRAPHRPTLLYRMKVYDEVLLAPRAFFRPEVIDFDSKLRHIAYHETYLDRNAQEDDGHDLPAGIANANDVAYNTYIRHPEAYVNGRPAAATPTDVGGVSGDESYGDSDSSAPRRAKRARTSRRRSLEEMPVDVTTVPEGSTSAVSRSASTLEVDLSSIDDPQPIPIKHFLRRRREVGTLTEVSLPLDVALGRSLQLYGNAHPETREPELELRMRKIFSSILVMGGGAMIPGLARQIETRLPKVLEGTKLHARVAAASRDGTAVALTPRVLQNPRDIDGRVLAWKGGAIFGKLDTTNDLWLSRKDCDAWGGQAVASKLMFAWE